MKFVPVLKTMINITLVAALVAAGAWLYVWKNSDQLVQDRVLAEFAKIAPDLELRIGRTVVQGTQGATLADVTVLERATSRELVRAKEVRVSIDAAQLVDRQSVVIDTIHVMSADILLTRLEDGRWNWQQYQFHPPAKKSPVLPRVVAEDLRVQLTLKHGPNIPIARLPLSSPRFVAQPSSQHAYDFDGSVVLPAAGELNLGGHCDLESAEWKIGGRLKDVQARQALVNLAVATNPQIQDQLEQLGTAMNQAMPHQPTQTTRPASTALLIGNDSQSAPRLSGLMDVDFNAGSVAGSSIPAFQLLVGIRDGQISWPAIPLPLTEVRAKFYKDNTNLEFRLEHAASDGATISGDVLISTKPAAAAPVANFKVERFPISRKLRPLLFEKAQRIFDAFDPEGVISGTGKLIQQPNGKWRPENIVATVHEGTVTYHKFRYPAKEMTGTITQRPFRSQPASASEPALSADDIMLDIKLTGKLGENTAAANGWWRNPGPEPEMRFEVTADDFPLDSRFRNALEEKHQSVVQSLALEGRTNAKLIFYRPPGRDIITQPYFDLRIFDARLRFSKFPYDIEQLTGQVTFHGPTKHWRFHNLHGTHGLAKLQGHGEFRAGLKPGVLDLSVSAKSARLDADLYNALSRPHRDLWNMVNPDGFCDLTAAIQWTNQPGQAAVVSFPEATPVRIYNTKIRPTPFPFSMLIQEAQVSFDPNDPRNAGSQHCEIHSFAAVHDDAPLSARGWIEGKPNGEWQIHLNDVNAKNLKPDNRLKAALPVTWRETLKKIQNVGRLSIQNSEMDFRGDISGQMNTTARWNLNLGFHDCTLNAGQDVSHVYGLVTADGVWDGFQLQNTGQIQLETAEVLEMPFTAVRGPYSLNDIELVLGNREVFEDAQPLSQVDRTERMQCQAYGGQLLFDALVDMRDDGQYRFFTELSNARLESYAALHIPDQENLRGVVTAWMSLQGHGEDAANLSGRGQLRISPAALYELPVVVKLLGSLSQLNLNVQNLTAFDYALLNFNVREEAFWLNPVDLVGESISFRGKGSVGFSGAVDLDFYSRPARTRTVALPFISGLFTNWARISVRGTTDRPQTRAAPLGQLDEGMKQFLSAFNPNPSGPVPGLVVPRFLQPTPMLLQRRSSSGMSDNDDATRLFR